MTLRSLAVVAETFAVPSPAQQLVDRLLAGYPRDGAFRPRVAEDIRLFCPGVAAAEIERRQSRFRLVAAPTLEAALTGADGAVLVGPGNGHTVAVDRLAAVVGGLPPGARCFVHGVVSGPAAAVRSCLEMAREKRIEATSATPLATTFRLPEIRVPAGQRLAETLIVVQGPDDAALVDGIEGLLSDLERGGASFPSTALLAVESLRGDTVWPAGDQGRWPRDLLAAAISRSDNPQGDPVNDGRTQDLVGLGLVPRLARNPRAWITRHGTNCRSTILALDGVVADINLAWRTRRGAIGSTQLYRPPAPGQHAFDGLVAILDDFLHGHPLPWSRDRLRHAAEWLAVLRG